MECISILQVRFEQQENDRQGMLQCQAVSSDLGVDDGADKVWGRSEEDGTPGRKEQGCLSKPKMHPETDKMCRPTITRTNARKEKENHNVK